jgi:hypothetical protein
LLRPLFKQAQARLQAAHAEGGNVIEDDIGRIRKNLCETGFSVGRDRNGVTEFYQR